MYRSDLDSRDRGGVALAVIAVHAALALVLLNLSGRLTVAGAQQALRVFDIREIPPPPPPPPPPVAQQQAHKAQPKAQSAPAAPKNIKSEATPAVAPAPRILLPTPPQITVSTTPRLGTQPTQGASDVRGPGTGAGAGTGTGSGDSGSGGTGSGGSGDGGGIAAGPQLLTPKLASRDFPPEIIRIWPRGGAVFVAMRVQTDGRATDCRVDRSVGNPVIDAWTCRLVETRLHFRPAVNHRGEPIVSWFGYIQREIGR